MMRSHTKLTKNERDQIALLRAQKVGIRKIARALDRSPSTISDELKRNRNGEYYVAIHAQALTEARKQEAGKRHPLKNPSVYKYVMKKLGEGWSPEQISGRLKLKKPENSYWHICIETIYQFIYEEDNAPKRLWEYLPRKQKKRKEHHGRGVHRSQIPDRVSIHLRPNEVNSREEFGHWEGDSVIGRRIRGVVIHTQVERQTRYLQAQLQPNLEATSTVKAQKNIFKSLPRMARRSTTLDNGSEFVKHKMLHELEMETYFADPYSSWQRGTNEYHNGLLRRYLPKKTSFDNLMQEEVDGIIEELNNRPRKCLGFRTPSEVFNHQLQLLCSDST